MNLYSCDMVSVQIDDDVMKKLQARAEEAGISVAELIARFADNDDVAYDFTPEQEDQIMESIAQADRGEVVSEDEAMAALRALSRR